MNNRLVYTLISLILIIGLVLLWTTSVTLGDDGDTLKAVTQADISKPGSQLDSVYMQINSNFETIRPLMAGACFDCQTAQTDYPWYHKLPLIGGWMDGHIREGRGELDMSVGFPFQSHMPPAESLAKIKEEIEEGEMPLWSYRLMHSSARLSDEQKDSIYTWVAESLQLLETQGITPSRQNGEESEH